MSNTLEDFLLDAEENMLLLRKKRKQRWKKLFLKYENVQDPLEIDIQNLSELETFVKENDKIHKNTFGNKKHMNKDILSKYVHNDKNVSSKKRNINKSASSSIAYKSDVESNNYKCRNGNTDFEAGDYEENALNKKRFTHKSTSTNSSDYQSDVEANSNYYKNKIENSEIEEGNNKKNASSKMKIIDKSAACIPNSSSTPFKKTETQEQDILEYFDSTPEFLKLQKLRDTLNNSSEIKVNTVKFKQKSKLAIIKKEPIEFDILQWNNFEDIFMPPNASKRSTKNQVTETETINFNHKLPDSNFTEPANSIILNKRRKKTSKENFSNSLDSTHSNKSCTSIYETEFKYSNLKLSSSAIKSEVLKNEKVKFEQVKNAKSTKRSKKLREVNIIVNNYESDDSDIYYINPLTDL